MSKPQRESDAPRSRLRRLARTLIQVAAILLVIVMIASISGCCDKLFYYPDAVVYSTPKDFGLRYEPVEFTSADGTRLSGWFLPAIGAATGTVVHCHGNAQNMTSHWQFAKFLPGRGFNLLVFDYRGYGRSEGKPSRAGTIADARAAVEYVLSRKDVDPARVALFGQSLGGAIATVVAATDKRIKALLIDSAFSSYQAEAAHVLRSNPVTWLFSWPLSRALIRSGSDPIDCIGELAPRPVLIVHGAADRLIPCQMSRDLMARAGDPKELWIVDGAAHTAASQLKPDEFEARACALFDRAFTGTPAK